jgi:hypothetical protein
MTETKYFKYKAYTEKTIFRGESIEDKKMYHSRYFLTFKTTTNIFEKRTTDILHAMIKYIKQITNYNKAYVQFYINFYDIGGLSGQKFEIKDRIVLVPYVYPSDETYKKIEEDKDKYWFNIDEFGDYETYKKYLYDNSLDSYNIKVPITDGIFKQMIIYIMPYTTTIQRVGENKNNDCMYKAIRNAVGFYNLPKKIKYDDRLKKSFKIQKEDKFILSTENIFKLEKMLNMPIIIKGWKEENNFNHYVHPDNSNHIINLKIDKNDHVVNVIDKNKYIGNDETMTIYLHFNVERKGGFIA